MSHANLGRDLLDRAAELLTEHGTVERPPLLEGRNMYIVMAPLEKRPEKKTDEEARAARRQRPPRRKPAATGERGRDDRRCDSPPRAGAPTATVEPPAQQRRAAAGRTGIAVPKIKTHKGTAKRYKKTGSGKWVRPEGLARPPPGDQVQPPHPALRRQGHRLQGAQASSSSGCCRTRRYGRWLESSAALPPTAATSACWPRRRAGAAPAPRWSARRARRCSTPWSTPIATARAASATCAACGSSASTPPRASTACPYGRFIAGLKQRGRGGRPQGAGRPGRPRAGGFRRHGRHRQGLLYQLAGVV